MKAVTEAYLRSAFREKAFNHFYLEEGQILTPSAAQFLREKRIEIGSKKAAATAKKPARQTPAVDIETIGEDLARQKSYVSAVDGAVYEKKPEYMTHLRGNRLVAKDHPRIFLRGKLDNFQSAVLLLQADAADAGQNALVEDLGDVLRCARAILKAEVLEKPLEEARIIGLDRAGLREHSHYPRKHYGIRHITPEYQMGRLLLGVNELRSQVRSVELAAVKAFRGEFTIDRPDLIEVLNAMSSALYIIMLRHKSAWYSTSNAGKKAN